VLFYMKMDQSDFGGWIPPVLEMWAESLTPLLRAPLSVSASRKVGLLDFLSARQQRRSQEFDLGGYKWVKETKQPYKQFKVD